MSCLSTFAGMAAFSSAKAGDIRGGETPQTTDDLPCPDIPKSRTSSSAKSVVISESRHHEQPGRQVVSPRFHDEHENEEERSEAINA
jgi:hypothetical protein